MKRILIFSTRIPYPKTAGFRKRILKIAEILHSGGYLVDLFYLSKGKADEALEEQLAEHFDRIFSGKISQFRMALNLIGSFLTTKSLQVNLYFSNKVLSRLKDITEKNGYDMIIWNHIRSTEYTKRVDFSGTNILDFHDSLAFHYKTSVDLVKGLWKLIYSYEWEKIQQYEREALPLYDLALITSKVDKEFIDGNEEKIHVIPMGIEHDLLQRPPAAEEDNSLTFLGKMDYYPNVDAVKYFCESVFPAIDSNNVTFKILGTNPNQTVKNLEKIDRRVRVLGFVDDPYELMLKSKIVVAPVRIGGGIQNKILEGMALGKTVITFKDRIRAMENVSDGKDLVAVDTTEDYIAELNRLLNSPERRNQIGEQGREYIKNYFTWESIGIKILNLLSSEIKKKG